MRHDGIDESAQYQRIAKVGRHFAPLRQRARHNRGGRGRKGILVKAKGGVEMIARQKKVRLSHKGNIVAIAAATSIAKGQSVAHCIKGQSRSTRIEQIFEHLQGRADKDCVSCTWQRLGIRGRKQRICVGVPCC
jgi:hypothetical protein